MKFTKMHGCGNDYVYVETMTQEVENRSEIAIKYSDRHFGIGGDGVIFINKSDIADFVMEMYNADGSRGKMCGNGIRCVAKFVYDKGFTTKNPLTIESFGSVKTLYLTLKDNKVEKVRVDMGEPILDCNEIGMDATHLLDKPDDCNRVIDAAYLVDGNEKHMTAVSMGNPHAVVFVDDTKNIEMEKIGNAYEHHPAFPEGVNTEFIRVISKSEIEMRVWERGSGETLACGTGACASVTACVLNNLTDRKVTVHLLGGDLEIEWNKEDNHIYMTGPATTVFEGEV